MDQSDLDLLQTVPPYHLQSLVKLRHLPLSPKGQGANPSSESFSTTVSEIAQHLFDRPAINEAVQSLTDVEGLILRELIACGGRANSRDLALYLASSGLLNPMHVPETSSLNDPAAITSVKAFPQYPTPHPHGPFEQALRHLLVLGLLFWGKQTSFAGRDYTSGIYDGVLIVPQAVREELKSAPHEYHGEENSQQTAVRTGEIGEDLRAFQRTLYLYWSFVASVREGLQLISSGLLSRATLRQLMGVLDPKEQFEQLHAENEIPHVLFVRLLLMKLGLLQLKQGALHAAPADDFFALSLLERTRRCYRLWLETPFWNELAYLPEVIVRPGPTPLDQAHDEVVRSRQKVLERVLYEEPGVWHALPAFIARTKLYAPYLLFPRQYGPRAERYLMGSNPYGWDFRLRLGWLTPREGWHMVEGGFIRAIISGPLHWLGLLDIKNENHSSAFRLAAGITLVTNDALPAIADPPQGRLIVQPNFELVALAPLSEALLIKLDRFAERLSLEHVAQYRLTKASVVRAIQSGLPVDTIQMLLENAARGVGDGGGAEIPQNVQYSLLEWERQARRIEVWQGATLLEVDDASLLDDLFANEAIHPLLGRRLAPLLAEVAPHQLAALQQLLWQRNYLPSLTPAPIYDSLMENARLVVREPQWRLHDDGLLQPLYPVLNLYLAAEVERISEHDELTGWRKITPLAIQLVRDAGLSLDAIIRFLQQYCKDGIPTSFLIRLKLWGGGYVGQDRIQVEQAPMLYLSAQVLQDLKSDEALSPLLGTEVAQQGRVVRVPPENLDRVIDLLKDHGFIVD